MRSILTIALSAVLGAASFAGCAASRQSTLPGGLDSVSANGATLDIRQQLKSPANPASVLCCVYVSQAQSPNLLEYNYQAKGAPVCTLSLTTLWAIQSDPKHELIVPTGGYGSGNGVNVYTEHEHACLSSIPAKVLPDPYAIDGYSIDGRKYYLVDNDGFGIARITLCRLGRRPNCKHQLSNPSMNNPYAVTEDAAGGVYVMNFGTVPAKLFYFANGTGPGVALGGYVNQHGGGIYFDGFGNLLAIDAAVGSNPGSLYVYSGCPSACTAHGPFPLHSGAFYGSLGNGETRFMTISATAAQIDVYQYNGTYGITYLYSDTTGLSMSNKPIGIAQELR